jgi:DNA-binding MarR family transcriptional regulator
MMKAQHQQNSISNLLVQICKQRRNRSNALLAETNIHGGQDILLYYLNVEDGQTISALVDKMCIQYATISTMIDRMATAGMVTKEKDAADKRASRVYLTKKGAEAYLQVAEVWKVMEVTVTQGLSDQQKNDLVKLLNLVYKNLA